MLRILVRTDTPWYSMTRESYRAQVKNVNLPTALIKWIDTENLIDSWEAAYGLDYFLYRAAIKIACFAKLHETGIKVDLVSPGSPDSGDDIIIPVDDDDVIFPSVCKVKGVFEDPSINLVVWNGLTIDIHGKRRLEHMRRFLCTCNWAIRRSWLEENWNENDRRIILAKHQFANHYVARKLGITSPPTPDLMKTLQQVMKQSLVGYHPLQHPSVYELAEDHSIYYFHCGSISFLTHKRSWGKQNVTDYLRNIPLHPLFDIDIYNTLKEKRDNAKP